LSFPKESGFCFYSPIQADRRPTSHEAQPLVIYGTYRRHNPRSIDSRGDEVRYITAR
jgi:hypothetical protein